MPNPFIIDVHQLERIRDPERKRDAGRVLMEIGQDLINSADRLDRLHSLQDIVSQEAFEREAFQGASRRALCATSPS